MQSLLKMILAFREKFKRKDKSYFELNRKRNYSSIKRLFEKAVSDHTLLDQQAIDDCTWNDLNMEQIFSSIDRTITTPGEQQLYRILRIPLTEERTLRQRGKTISFFHDHPGKREQIQQELWKLGRTDHEVTEVLSRELKGNRITRVFYSFFALFFLLTVFSFIFWGFNQYNSLTIVALFIVNMFIHGRMSAQLQEQVMVVQYIGEMINRIPRLNAVLATDLQDYTKRIGQCYGKCKNIGKKASVLSRVEGLDVLGDYLNIMLLVKERNYHAIASEIERKKEEISDLYAILGEIDALISVSLFRESLDYYTEPEFTDEIVLDMEAAVHPLLDNPVANSLQVTDKGVIITGSNMSGKSTFLRTVGVNSLLAQTIFTCLAKKYRTGLYHIVSSISLNDNLIDGKSFYLGEAEAIHRIVRASRETIPCLGLIDEIFKGTNPVERVNAAAEILTYLAEGNALVLVATHDLQLIPMIKGYDSYFFKEDVNEQGLVFDYLIHKGISSTKNAIKVLEFLGYPAPLIQRINQRIDKAEQEG